MDGPSCGEEIIQLKRAILITDSNISPPQKKKFNLYGNMLSCAKKKKKKLYTL